MSICTRYETRTCIQPQAWSEWVNAAGVLSHLLHVVINPYHYVMNYLMRKMEWPSPKQHKACLPPEWQDITEWWRANKEAIRYAILHGMVVVVPVIILHAHNAVSHVTILYRCVQIYKRSQMSVILKTS